MQLAMTFEDPKTYTKPWTINLAVNFLPDTDLLENIGLENEKDRPKLVGRVADEQRSAKKVARSVLAGYAGTYEVEMLGAWTVSVDGDQLNIELADGGGKQPAYAQSDTVFSFPGIGGTVKFVTDAKGVATHFFLTIVEGDIKAVKKEGECYCRAMRPVDESFPELSNCCASEK